MLNINNFIYFYVIFCLLGVEPPEGGSSNALLFDCGFSGWLTGNLSYKFLIAQKTAAEELIEGTGIASAFSKCSSLNFCSSSDNLEIASLIKYKALH